MTRRELNNEFAKRFNGRMTTEMFETYMDEAPDEAVLEMIEKDKANEQSMADYVERVKNEPMSDAMHQLMNMIGNN